MRWAPGWKPFVMSMVVLGMSIFPLFDSRAHDAVEHVDEETPVIQARPEDATDSTEVLAGEAQKGDSVEEETHAESFWQRMDRWHDETYVVSHQQVVRMNGWFVPRGEAAEEVPPTRLRISLPCELILEPDDSVSGKFPVEADVEITLPDAERLKVFITTTDPNETAGTPMAERDTSLRVGVAREWLEYISASAGVKARIPPVVYAWVAGGTVWQRGAWRYFPNQKFFWDIEDGDGEITSFVADRWSNPWDIRLVSSLKWSRDKMDSDDRAGNGEHGWQWDCGLIFGYARELLREPEVVRFMGGKDLARGVALRLGISGGPWSRDTVSALLLHKGQLRARWLYYFIEPEVQWACDDDWARTITLTCGIEAIFWGGQDR